MMFGKGTQLECQNCGNVYVFGEVKTLDFPKNKITLKPQ